MLYSSVLSITGRRDTYQKCIVKFLSTHIPRSNRSITTVQGLISYSLVWSSYANQSFKVTCFTRQWRCCFIGNDVKIVKQSEPLHDKTKRACIERVGNQVPPLEGGNLGRPPLFSRQRRHNAISMITHAKCIATFN